MLKMPFTYLCLLLISVGAWTTAFASEKSFLDEIKNSQEKFDNRAVSHVRMVTEESVLAEENDQRGSFRVLARKQEITRYKCSSCHNTKPVKANKAKELTHGNIILDHGKRVSNWAGERVVFNCATCHDPHSPRFEKRFPATYSVPLD